MRKIKYIKFTSFELSSDKIVYFICTSNYTFLFPTIELVRLHVSRTIRRIVTAQYEKL